MNRQNAEEHAAQHGVPPEFGACTCGDPKCDFLSTCVDCTSAGLSLDGCDNCPRRDTDSDSVVYPIGELLHHIEAEVAEWIREAKAHAWNECNERWRQRGLTPDINQTNPYQSRGVMR